MPDVAHTDSLVEAQKVARALLQAKIYGQVKIIKKRPYDDIGVRQLPYTVWVANEQGGAASATVAAAFKRRRR